jgi:hypothetical protein
MSNHRKRALAPLLLACSFAFAPSASADVATYQASVDEAQCAGVATWVKTGEGVNGASKPYGDFRVSFPSPTAACSVHYASATSAGAFGHGGPLVDTGPYTMNLHCVSSVAGHWQAPYNCSDGWSLDGPMEWATGATTLYHTENGYWTGGAAMTFGPRMLATGAGPFFPSRWTSTFTLTGDYARVTSY